MGTTRHRKAPHQTDSPLITYDWPRIPMPALPETDLSHVQRLVTAISIAARASTCIDFPGSSKPGRILFFSLLNRALPTILLYPIGARLLPRLIRLLNKNCTLVICTIINNVASFSPPPLSSDLVSSGSVISKMASTPLLRRALLYGRHCLSASFQSIESGLM